MTRSFPQASGRSPASHQRRFGGRKEGIGLVSDEKECEHAIPDLEQEAGTPVRAHS